MIHDFDRSGFFGGSDTRYIMANNRNTKTWIHWWDVKLGKIDPEFKGNIYTKAGNIYEHPILYSIDWRMAVDEQIIIDKYLLRVNYDGRLDSTLYEVKTHKNDKEFEVTTAYWQQAQVEMYAYKTMSKKYFLPDFEKLYIVSYALSPDEYYCEEDEVEIDPDRIKYHEIKYDKAWIKGEYLPRLKELSRALKKRKSPV